MLHRGRFEMFYVQGFVLTKLLAGCTMMHRMYNIMSHTYTRYTEQLHAPLLMFAEVDAAESMRVQFMPFGLT